MGIGALPNYFRRWRQIRRLHLCLYKRMLTSTGVKLLHFYLQAFAATVDQIAFTFCDLPHRTTTRLTFVRRLSPASRPRPDGLPLRLLGPYATDPTTLTHAATNAREPSAFLETQRLASSTVHFHAVQAGARTLRHMNARLGCAALIASHQDSRRTARGRGGGHTAGRPGRQERDAERADLELHTLMQMRAARTLLAIGAKEAVGRAGSETARADKREMLKERARGCKTPLIEYM
ncbi:MAG: hypothetical protein MMC33_009645 [Icmadophila ericetorum]|nr:hypothetical protein [Icmadophila ericetorum]